MGLRVGLRCPGWSFCSTLHQHRPPPMPFLLTTTLGLEQLRSLRHLDVAYNLLEGHRELTPLWLLAELRKVRPERFQDLLGPGSQLGTSPCLPG